MKLPLLWRYTGREVERRPERALLTLLGIVIGVAASLAITVTVQATRAAHRDMFEAVAGRAALEVVAPGLGGFDAELAAELAAVPGVRAAVPVVQTPAGLVGPGGTAPVLLLGIDPARDGAARDYVLREGHMLDDAEGLLLEAGFAASQGFRLGQPVRVLTTTGFATLPVRGLLEPGGATAFNGGAVVFVPLPVAQRWFRLAGQVNSVQLILADGADGGRVETEVRRRLPAGLIVQTPAVRGAVGREGLASTEQVLAGLSVCSLVAGAFVILNAFLMNLGERRRQLAILRALGATRGQVSWLLLREAVLLGGTGTVLGLLVGWGLSHALRRTMSSVLSVTLPEPQWSGWPVLLALALGPGMTLAATIVPARRASRRAPLPDLLLRQGNPAEEPRRWPAYLGLAFILATLAFVVAVIRSWVDPAWAMAVLSVVLGFLLTGCVLVVPLFLQPALRLTGVLLGPLARREGAIALRQLARHPGRTALTVGVLLIAVILAIGLGQSLLNNVRHIQDWFEHILYADFYLRAAWPDYSAAITTAALPESFAAEVAGLEGVEHAGRLSFVPARAEDRPIIVLAWSLAPSRPFPLALVEGDRDALPEAYRRGEVLLGTALGHRLGRGAGDTITLQTRHGPRTLRVAGTVAEYTGGGLSLYMDWDAAQRLFALDGIHALTVVAQPDARARLGDQLQARCRERSYLFQSANDARRTLQQQMDGVIGLVWVLMALIFVVASLGIVNTLTMNVLEQTRELGVLRAVGLKRNQVARMFLVQALVLSLVSLVPGVVVGLVLAYLMNLSTYPLSGHVIPFRVQAELIGACALAALVITALAALVPARRAARLQVIAALQYE